MLNSIANSHRANYAAPINIVAMLKTWSNRFHQRRELAKLTYMQLADIGVSVSMRDAELRKFVWQS